MKQRKGVFSWENEPADGRRSEFRSSTDDSSWEHSSNSTFVEPSRHEHRHQRRRERERRESRARRLSIVVAMLALSALAATWALWPAVQRQLDR